jgi:Zn-dependent protease
VPRRPEAEYVVAAIVTAVAYMGSLLAHELAHSLVARRNGVQVEGITRTHLGGPRGWLRTAGVLDPQDPQPEQLASRLNGAVDALIRAAED